MADKGFPVEESLSNPRMSFCKPRISGRVSRGPIVRVAEEGGRPNEVCRRTRRGRAVVEVLSISFGKGCEIIWTGRNDILCKDVVTKNAVDDDSNKIQ